MCGAASSHLKYQFLNDIVILLMQRHALKLFHDLYETLIHTLVMPYSLLLTAMNFGQDLATNYKQIALLGI